MHLLPRHRAVGEQQARLNVLRFEKRVLLQDQLCGVPGCQHAQDMFNGDAHVPDNRLSAEDVWAHGDAFEQFVLGRYPAPSSGFVIQARL